LSQRIQLDGDVEVGIVVPKTTALLGAGDVVTLGINNVNQQQLINGGPEPSGSETFYPIDAPASFPRSCLHFRYDRDGDKRVASFRSLPAPIRFLLGGLA